MGLHINEKGKCYCKEVKVIFFFQYFSVSAGQRHLIQPTIRGYKGKNNGAIEHSCQFKLYPARAFQKYQPRKASLNSLDWFHWFHWTCTAITQSRTQDILCSRLLSIRNKRYVCFHFFHLIRMQLYEQTDTS